MAGCEGAVYLSGKRVAANKNFEQMERLSSLGGATNNIFCMR